MTGSFRLVAIDVDGTLIERGKPVTEAVRAAITLARARGVVVTLASGRMYPLLADFVKALGIDSPVICYGGALIVNPVDRQPLRERGVPLTLAREVIRAARQRGLLTRAYVGERVFVDRGSLEPTAFNYDSLLRVRAEPVGDLLRFLRAGPTHLAVDAPEGRTRFLVEEMRNQFGSRLHVTTGHPLLTEFSRPGVHKGSALRWLARTLGIKRHEILAIGDDWNDVEMLDYAGLGVAVANAHPRVLARVRATVPSVAADGVAVAIQRYVLDAAPPVG